MSANSLFFFLMRGGGGGGAAVRSGGGSCVPKDSETVQRRFRLLKTHIVSLEIFPLALLPNHEKMAASTVSPWLISFLEPGLSLRLGLAGVVGSSRSGGSCHFRLRLKRTEAYSQLRRLGWTQGVDRARLPRGPPPGGPFPPPTADGPTLSWPGAA